MDISRIPFPRTVQEILHDYQQGILKSEPREQPGDSRTPAVVIGLSDARRKGATLPAAIKKTDTVRMLEARPGVAISVLVPLLDAQDAWRLELGRIDRWQRWSVPLRP
jgi:hypothetical protein